MTGQPDSTAMLPGLELEPEAGQASNPMRAAVVATLAALKEDQLLEPRHAGLCQLALILADAVMAGTRGGRASAAAMAAAQLRETLDALPKPVSADSLARFNAAVDRLLTEPLSPPALG